MTMLEAVIATARGAGLSPILAVVPPGLAVPPDVVPVPNDRPLDGLSRSLRIGLAAIPSHVDATVILLGDQPTLRAETIRMILDATHSTHAVVVARAGGRVGPPALIRASAFWLADEATGDEGLRTILSKHPELVTAVDVGEHAPDVDTPADLDSIRLRQERGDL
jgi:molybdenum cofactor cytidylyltransferase